MFQSNNIAINILNLNNLFDHKVVPF